MKRQFKLEQLVTEHPFLAGVKPDALRLFCQMASLKSFRKGQRIFHEGAEADCFYLINEGQVVLEMSVPGQRNMTIQALGPGEALGWSWLFPPYQWHFSSTASAPTRALVFPAKALRVKAQQDHEFCYELVVRLASVLVGRLEDIRTRLIYTRAYAPSSPSGEVG